MRVSLKTGVGCKYAGVWLVATSALLVYGETAPSIPEPDFTIALVCLGFGTVIYSLGCFCCLRARRVSPSDR